MQPFAYRRADSERDALVTIAARPDAAFIAGATDLMQLWKSGVVAPDLVIDISRLPLDSVEEHEDRVSIGALARMSDVADHGLIRGEFPAVAEALLASASPQVRNVATI